MEDSKKGDHAVRVLEESAFPYRKSVTRGSGSGGSNRKSIKEQIDEEQKIDPY